MTVSLERHTIIRRMKRGIRTYSPNTSVTKSAASVSGDGRDRLCTSCLLLGALKRAHVLRYVSGLVVKALHAIVAHYAVKH